jgi:predicted phage tail protein
MTVGVLVKKINLVSGPSADIIIDRELDFDPTGNQLQLMYKPNVVQNLTLNSYRTTDFNNKTVTVLNTNVPFLVSEVLPNSILVIGESTNFKIVSLREMDKGHKFQVTAILHDNEKYNFIDKF